MNKQQCPICSEQNNCGLENNGGKDCWCFHVGGVSQSLLDAIPEEMKGKRCICEDCIKKYKN